MYDFYFRCRKKNKFRSFSTLLASFVKMQTIGKFFKEAKRQDESLYTVFSKTMYIQRHILLPKPRPNTELKNIVD
ncbi:hypothetical protein CBG49_14770 [Capnocytophaga endodontalis]|uniref:Uncharacterized protein n=1 Tax=Capnocytophaga endodontalis TaxID=2708117 RepID=A0A1Z4BSH3_9FLAO|nr:hypothetical protein CBG49_14770 [Capnocytophaga endodontalis]